MEKIIEIPEGYEARIEGNKVIIESKESEDERIRQMIDNTLHYAVISEHISETSYREMSAYLERQKEKKPAEWSEEDRTMAKNLASYLELAGGYFSCNGITKDEYIKWLRSLRPHWKPSEEQMEWLESAVKLSTDKPHIHGIIISLYEQLKRL